jgi:hypothetical protein
MNVNLITRNEYRRSLPDEKRVNTNTRRSLREDLVSNTSTRRSLREDLVSNTSTRRSLQEDLVSNTSMCRSLQEDLVSNTNTRRSLQEDLVPNTSTRRSHIKRRRMETRRHEDTKGDNHPRVLLSPHLLSAHIFKLINQIRRQGNGAVEVRSKYLYVKNKFIEGSMSGIVSGAVDCKFRRTDIAGEERIRTELSWRRLQEPHGFGMLFIRN